MLKQEFSERMNSKLLYIIIYLVDIGYDKEILLINELDIPFLELKLHMKRLIRLKLIKREFNYFILTDKAISMLKNGYYSIEFYK